MPGDKEAIRALKERENEQKPPYDPDQERRDIWVRVSQRIKDLKQYRKDLGIEREWSDADKEYVPEPLGRSTNIDPKRAYELDDTIGIRGPLVPVSNASQDWRSTNSDPSLLVKIQTAISVIIDANPEAALVALEKQFEKRTDLANAMWKRYWEVSGSRNLMKLFVFNLAKYGWGVGRTFPKKMQFDKKILVEKDLEDPEKDHYEMRTITRYDDLAKEILNPWKTWVDDGARPYDPDSMNDCYFEVEMNYDVAALPSNFGRYKHWDSVSPSSVKSVSENQISTQSQADKNRKNTVTIGFYESRVPDLSVICVPQQNIILHHSPLENDEGQLSIWHSPWILRNAETPYGVSLWKIIGQDKNLYDKMKNMTMDQLVLSIFKMFFYNQGNQLTGDGKIVIEPGKGIPKIGDTTVNFLEIPGPGSDAFAGLNYLSDRMDENSGVSPALEGRPPKEAKGKQSVTQLLTMREAALKRLKAPIDNIAWAVEQDAHAFFSWAPQFYTTPQMVEFVADKDSSAIAKMLAYEKSSGLKHDKIFGKDDKDITGQVEGQAGGGILNKLSKPFRSSPKSIIASFLPQLALHAEDRNGSMVSSDRSNFLQVGNGKGQIKPEDLRWKGMFKVIPKSFLSPSMELEKARKMEVANTIVKLIVQDPAIYKKTVDQILKINDEDPEDWEPDAWIHPPPPPLFNAPAGQGGPPKPGQPPPQGGQPPPPQGGQPPAQGQGGPPQQNMNNPQPGGQASGNAMAAIMGKLGG